MSIQRKKLSPLTFILSFVYIGLFLTPSLQAIGIRQDNPVPAEGREVWEHEFPVTGIKKGKYNLIIRAKDAAGNLTEDGAYNIRVDPSAGLPQVQIVYPRNNSILRNNINIIGVAAGRFGISRVTVSVDGAAPTEARGTEYWNFPIDHSALPEGPHTLTIQAYDVKETSAGPVSLSFTLDRTPPSIEILNHKIGDQIARNTTVKGIADDPSGIINMEISSEGGPFVPLAFHGSRKSTEVTFSFPIRPRRINDGPVVYQIRATDGTGLVSTRALLYFISKVGPDLEIIAPAKNEDIFGMTRIVGRITSAVGLQKFYYEWNGQTMDIPLRPGDPFWSVDILVSATQARARNFRITAIDKNGNTSTLNQQFLDNRKLKTPTIVLDYPSSSALGSLNVDDSIFGHVADGFYGGTLIIEGVVEELPANPAFRIPPELIPRGRSTIRVWPRAADDTVGEPYMIRVNKANTYASQGLAEPTPSRLIITSPTASYVNGGMVILEGKIARTRTTASTNVDMDVLGGLGPEINLEDFLNDLGGDIATGKVTQEEIPMTPQERAALLSGMELEYRLFPSDNWKSITFNPVDGTFSAQLAIDHLKDGPIHLEVRTVHNNVEDVPAYYPLYKFLASPDIQLVSPAATDVVNGKVTVAGRAFSTAPIAEIAYSLDGESYTPLSIISRFGRSDFSFLCDFTALANAGQVVTVRVTDASGAALEKALDVKVDPASDEATVILNVPLDGETVTRDFEISGIAFDDDAVEAVYWRISPKNGRPSTASDPDPREGFQRSTTTDSFQIIVPISDIMDGEHVVEVYAEDTNGTRGKVATRDIKVSTAAPITVVNEPALTDYTHGYIYIRGAAYDDNGIDNVWVSMDNGNSYQRAELTDFIEGGQNWILSLSTKNYPDGVSTALIWTIDKFGVDAVSNSLINIDNTPPEVFIGAPVNGAVVGHSMEVSSRIYDNIGLQNLYLDLISVTNTTNWLSFDLEAKDVILESLDISSLPTGEYDLHLYAQDLAGNETVATRNVYVSADTSRSVAVLFSPLAGEVHSGPLVITGKAEGAYIPPQMTIWINGEEFIRADVDRYGYFYYQYPNQSLNNIQDIRIRISFETPWGETIRSNEHTIHSLPYGPMIEIDSHKDGDPVTGRPYLSGRAWFAPTPEETLLGTYKKMKVAQVLYSYDNGRTFHRTKGKDKWKFRVETSELSRGPLPILIRAEFNQSGIIATRRLLLIVDVDPPVVRTIQPLENTSHRDEVLTFGVAEDDYGVDTLTVSLRPHDKLLYSIPPFIQGLYVDGHFFGATYADMGLGLSFLEDNVKLQFQAGITPMDHRFNGWVFGMKLLANIYTLPFKYILGLDWSFFSMSFALGANFSYFTMNRSYVKNDPLILGSVLAQLEAKFEVEQWKRFKTYSVYLEPEFFFPSSDVPGAPKFIFRLTTGFRVYLFN